MKPVLLVPALAAALVSSAAPLAAQQNPFRAPTGTVKSALVQYTLTGDETGTEQLAFTPERSASRSNTTMRVLGKEVKVHRLDVETRDSSYHVDLEKKEGYRAQSQLPVVAAEYDKLSTAEKQRFQRNVEDLAGVIAQAFGAGALAGAARPQGRRTIAGQSCEEVRLGGFTSCTLVGAPDIPLKLEGELFCVRTSKVASAVSLNAPVPADKFAVPAGIKWKNAERQAMPAEDAGQLVRFLASQELADSLAQARRQIQAARDSAKARGEAPADTLTAEQREDVCKKMRDGIKLRVEVAPPNPAKMVQAGVTERMTSARALASALASAAAEEAKGRATEGLKKKLKPRFP
jgi:hypothetical protein